MTSSSQRDRSGGNKKKQKHLLCLTHLATKSTLRDEMAKHKKIQKNEKAFP